MEWVKKASFAHLNKLFEIDVAEWAHNVLLSDKNLQALIENLKPFISLVFLWLASSFLVPDKHFELKDLPFYKVARLVDFEACQARLEEWEKKCQERTLKQASATSRPASSSTIHPPTQKKKPTTHHI